MSPEQELERFFSLSLDLLCIAGFDGYFKRLNPAWERTFGWTLEELLARPFIDFVHPDDVARTTAAAWDAAAGDILTFENRYQCKDGSYRWVLWQSTPVPEQQLIYAAARDITERKLTEQAVAQARDDAERLVQQRTAALEHELRQRKSLEDQLLQAQKMEAIGRLAGGVAHDFNNLLTVILGNTELPQIDAGQAASFSEHLTDIKSAAERAAGLTQQLLALSRAQVLEMTVLDLNQVIADMDRMLRRLIGEDIDLRTVGQPGLDPVEADRGQLEQVILNLAVNARDAMPRGGKLTISTENVVLDETYTQEHADLTPGPYVLLAVSDTGHGMDAATQQRMFEPFFTTKEKGRGTGLGLSTVYGIVKQSGGHIWAYSEPGRGSTFKVYLPRAEGATVTPARPAVPGGSLRGSETVLLVEDDDAVRRLAMRALDRHGYRLLECPSAADALRASQQHDGPIHLMVTDVIMPEMGGRELADRLTGLRPELKVLYTSGYTGEAIVHHGVLESGIAYLQKPFTVEGLARKVREVLGEPLASGSSSQSQVP